VRERERERESARLDTNLTSRRVIKGVLGTGGHKPNEERETEEQERVDGCGGWRSGSGGGGSSGEVEGGGGVDGYGKLRWK